MRVNLWSRPRPVTYTIWCAYDGVVLWLLFWAWNTYNLVIIQITPRVSQHAILAFLSRAMAVGICYSWRDRFVLTGGRDRSTCYASGWIPRSPAYVEFMFSRERWSSFYLTKEIALSHTKSPRWTVHPRVRRFSSHLCFTIPEFTLENKMPRYV